jgi:hypothetical protein
VQEKAGFSWPYRRWPFLEAQILDKKVRIEADRFLLGLGFVDGCLAID